MRSDSGEAALEAAADAGKDMLVPILVLRDGERQLDFGSCCKVKRRLADVGGAEAAARPQSNPVGSAMALRAARSRAMLPAPMVMGRLARSRTRFEGSALLLDATLRRRRSSTPEARLSEQDRAKVGRSIEGPEGSTKRVDLDEDGSGALEVLCTLGLRLPLSFAHRGSTYSSSSHGNAMVDAAAIEGGAPLEGLSEKLDALLEKRNEESVACVSRHAGLSDRLNDRLG